jgi:hypothetical protein
MSSMFRGQILIKILEQSVKVLMVTTAWNTLNVTNISFMFLQNTMFNNGGPPSIGNWKHLKLLICQVCFFRQVSIKILGQR